MTWSRTLTYYRPINSILSNNPFLHIYSFWHINNRQLLKILWEKEKLLVKKQFFLFPQCFLLNHIIVSPFDHIFDIISLFAAEFEKPEIGISGKGSTEWFMISQTSPRFIFTNLSQEHFLSFTPRFTNWNVTTSDWLKQYGLADML